MSWLPPALGTQSLSLVFAFALSSLIGLERQRRLKSAGVRTHVLVGLGAALFTLVSAYGFTDVAASRAAVDPSRIAAQVVSGVGFLGGGVIFVRRNAVSGLTTAATVWMSAAVGMACGAGMPVVAAIGTTLHLVAVTFLPRVLHRFAPGVAGEQVALVQYREGRGALRSVLQKAAAEQFQVTFESAREIGDDGERPRIEARLRFAPSRRPLDRLIAEMAEVPGVTWVSLDEQEE